MVGLISLWNPHAFFLCTFGELAWILSGFNGANANFLPKKGFLPQFEIMFSLLSTKFLLQKPK